MNDKNTQTELYQSPICKLEYKDKKYADQCESWCKEHKSCNLDIIQYAEYGSVSE